MSSKDEKRAKKRERERELRDSTGCGFKKDLVADRHLDDQRYERSRAQAVLLLMMSLRGRVGAPHRFWFFGPVS